MDLHRAPPAEGHAPPAAPSSHEPGDLTDVGLRVGPIRTEPGRLTEQAGTRLLAGQSDDAQRATCEGSRDGPAAHTSPAWSARAAHRGAPLTSGSRDAEPGVLAAG